ncbi:hypothetical protein H1D32_11980 [Anaerobacillus sp. CMMVII]|uniref:hypothetical protein n=1 Tax=Anaerobacillus sp. CMMVII TaxID=2755588 RepID=UPI0021B77501|nr:hypothetical protein [Anaerobacillus sp. CMMVII]MCT8138404.1 hypothetical protein [Anaerobacillus sp. CMMVII]
MNTLINSKLSEVFDDFKRSVENVIDLCTLKEENLPDFSNPIIQQLYLLRHLPNDLFEYYHIYKQVIEQKHIDTPYHIFSLGAGSGIDYYGVELALKDVGKSVREYVYYTGIEETDWRYRHPLNNPDCRFLSGDLSKINREKLADANIIMFPKSMARYSESAYEELLQFLKKISFTESNLYLISSLNDLGDELEEVRFARLLDIFVAEQGYIDLDHETNYDTGGNKVSFDYPNHINEFLITLQSQCKSYDPYRKECNTLVSRF